MVLDTFQKQFINCLMDCYDIEGRFNLHLLIFLIMETYVLSLYTTPVTVNFDHCAKMELVQKEKAQA